MARAAQQIRGGVCAFESRAHPSPTVPTTLGERPHRALLRSLRPRERCSDLGRRDGALVAPACWTRRRPLAHFLLDRYVSRRLALWGGALLSSVWQDEPLPLPWTAFTQAARVSSVSPGVYLGHCSCMHASAVLELHTGATQAVRRRSLPGPMSSRLSSAGCTTTAACATSSMPCRRPPRRHAR